jgi:hypothetical protein
VSELFARTGVSVDADDDIVVLRVGSMKARFSYTTAFRIAQRMRLHGGVAARAAGVNPVDRDILKRKADETNLRPVKGGDARKNDAPWDVWNEGELVAVRLKTVIARWEAPAALTIAGWIRVAGRQAKHWAGDTSRTRRFAGILTDANENARLGE